MLSTHSSRGWQITSLGLNTVQVKEILTYTVFFANLKVFTRLSIAFWAFVGIWSLNSVLREMKTEEGAKHI